MANRTDSMDEFMDKLNQWLAQNYSSDLDATTIASALNMHRSWLHRKLKEATAERGGLSLSEYVTIFRLERARAMKDSGHSLKEIAFTVGFNDYVHFMRSYKKYYGASPSKDLGKN